MDMRMNRLWVRGHLRVIASGRFLPVPTDRNRPQAALDGGQLGVDSYTTYLNRTELIQLELSQY